MLQRCCKDGGFICCDTGARGFETNIDEASTTSGLGWLSSNDDATVGTREQCGEDFARGGITWLTKATWKLVVRLSGISEQ